MTVSGLDATNCLLHAVDEGVLEAANIVDRYSGAGASQRGAHPRVAAEIAAEQGIARQFIQAARRLLAVHIGILQELRGDADTAGDHVQVGRGGIVVDRDGVLLHTPTGRRQAVVEIGVVLRASGVVMLGFSPARVLVSVSPMPTEIFTRSAHAR